MVLIVKLIKETGLREGDISTLLVLTEGSQGVWDGARETLARRVPVCRGDRARPTDGTRGCHVESDVGTLRSESQSRA